MLHGKEHESGKKGLKFLKTCDFCLILCQALISVFSVFCKEKIVPFSLSYFKIFLFKVIANLWYSSALLRLKRSPPHHVFCPSNELLLNLPLRNPAIISSFLGFYAPEQSSRNLFFFLWENFFRQSISTQVRPLLELIKSVEVTSHYTKIRQCGIKCFRRRNGVVE